MRGVLAASSFVAVVGCLDTAVAGLQPGAFEVKPVAGCVVVGRSQVLQASVVGRRGQSGGRLGVAWSSSDTGVATVDDSGLVIGLRPGDVEITATVESQTRRIPMISSRAIVTFIIDDGLATDYTVKKPIFDAHGAIGVSAVISDSVNGKFLSDSQLLALQASGWEIASHSRTHAREDTLTEAQLEDEIAGSKAALEARSLRINTFVYPWGVRSELGEQIVRQNYAAAATASPDPNLFPLHDLYALNRYNFGSRYALPGQNTPAYYKALVDSSANGGLWLLFMLHELDSADQGDLGDLLDYINSKSIPITAFSEGLDRVAKTAPSNWPPAVVCKP